MAVQLMNGMSDELPDELVPFEEKLSPRFFDIRKKIIKFVLEEVKPRHTTYREQKDAMLKALPRDEGDGLVNLSTPQPPIFFELQQKAKEAGLWNFFLPEVCGLTVLEYAPLAEILGAFPLANSAMNCSAPDTGNMEVLEKYGTPEQKRQWLEPLLEGRIRSAFAMTEPGVASSDATNICSTIVREGDEYVINGHKWYISGAIRPECKVLIFMGRSNSDPNVHQQQSMIIVPRDAPGVRIVRGLAVFGHIHDHAEIIFDDVRVPVTNMLLGEGRGFEIAQGRLGPGRIHHCMRTLGVAEMALAAAVHRIYRREAFGKMLYQQDTIRSKIAEARIEITKCRQLCYLAATMADKKGFKDAKKYISMIKVAAPRCALEVIDEAMQIHGAHGVSQDSRLSDMYAQIRTLRIADGPDIVQLNTIVKSELAESADSPFGASVSGTNKNIAKYGKYKQLLGYDTMERRKKPVGRLGVQGKSTIAFDSKHIAKL
jgi:acyl-CoA dehydrogenase